MTESRLRPEGEEKIAPSPGSTLPGAGGPVRYPNTPSDGDAAPVNGAGSGPLDNLPGGTARWPEPFPATVGPQQGAGSGSGGLYPNPGEPADGSLVTGWKGASYVKNSPTSGETFPGESTPTSFTDL